MLKSCRLWLLLGYALVACAKNHEGLPPQVDSETHFLRSCSATCGDALLCICGVCTAACSADRECQGYAEAARCTELGTGQTQTCGAQGVPQICDVTCALDADCALLGADYFCQQGSCRGPSVEQPPEVKETSGALTYASGGRRLKAQHYVADGATQFTACTTKSSTSIASSYLTAPEPGFTACPRMCRARSTWTKRAPSLRSRSKRQRSISWYRAI